jgi:hypothetical protein
MQETKNYHLKQIENDDKPSEYPSTQSENMQVIDEQMHELATEVTPIERGGTGASTAAKARTNLDVYSKSEVDTTLGNFITTKSTQGPAYGPLVSVTAEGHAEQDGTPTPSDPKEIVVVRGRNLLNPSGIVAGRLDGSGNIYAEPNHYTTDYIPVESGDSLTLSIAKASASYTAPVYYGYAWYDSGKTFISRPLITQSWNAGKSNQLTVPSNGAYIRVFAPETAISDAIQLELGSTVHPYVPYGHVGLEVATPMQVERVDYYIPDSGIDTAIPYYNIHSTKASGGSYALRFMQKGNSTVRVHAYDSNGAWIAQAANLTVTATQADGETIELVTLPDGTATVRVSAASLFTDFELVSTTPIPLPSRGWVGSLPDGTHDALAIDGAGKVTWELVDDMTTLDGSGTAPQFSWQTNAPNAFFIRTQPHGVTDYISIACYCDKCTNEYTAANMADGRASGKYAAAVGGGNCVYFNVPSVTTREQALSWLAETKPTLLLPLATPTTVNVGYVDLPDIPDGAVVSMPELEGLGVESWTSDAVARYVRAWAARS